MKSAIRVLGVSLLACAAVAFAAVDAYTIKFAPKEGATKKYRITAQLDVNGTPITFSALSQETITKVAEDGTYTIEQNQLEAKMNDLPTENLTRAFTTTVKPGGVIAEIKGDDVGSADYRFANLTQFVEPDKAVSVGDKWSHEFVGDAKLGSLKATSNFEVVGEEKVGDVDALKIKQSSKETEGDDKAGVEGFVWISKADSSLLKSQSKWTNVPVPGAPILVTADVTMAVEA